MSSDDRHPADFLCQLASAIKAVRDRGGKWNKTADTIQWAHDKIVRLERELATTQKELADADVTIDNAAEQLTTLESKLDAAEERLAQMTENLGKSAELYAQSQSRLDAMTTERDDMRNAFDITHRGLFASSERVIELEDRLDSGRRIAQHWADQHSACAIEILSTLVETSAPVDMLAALKAKMSE